MDILKNIFLYSEESPLFFSRMYFWIFFTIVLAIYSSLYKKNVARNLYLFLVSLFFYYKAGGYFFSLLIFSTVVDYFISHFIDRSNKTLNRKLLLILSIVINLGVLAYFKYAYFFTDVFNAMFDTNIKVQNVLAQWTNSMTGSGFDIDKIILPVGISFFTFQTISYTVDVYRRKIAPVENLTDFGFYVSFFPQLVAGPIVRASFFVPQLYQKYKLTKQEMGHALFLIMSGLFKKMVISDYISINFVDRVFEAPLDYPGFLNLLASYGYALQIYCDFSGYTDIAIGLALLLGYRLPINFNSPYKAESLTDFWHRWHISLSSWLRDYLYIPLGGNKKGKVRTIINIIITMLLGGLWHGASLRFIIWGGLHGLGLAWEKIWSWIRPRKTRRSKFFSILKIVSTFHFVTFLWIFFRAPDMETALNMINQIEYNFNAQIFTQVITSYKNILLVMSIGFMLHWMPVSITESYRGWYIKTPIWVKMIFALGLLVILYQVKSAELQPFIYFQF